MSIIEFGLWLGVICACLGTVMFLILGANKEVNPAWSWMEMPFVIKYGLILFIVGIIISCIFGVLSILNDIQNGNFKYPLDFLEDWLSLN